MQIRPLTSAESDAAVQLWHESGLTRPWNDPDADLARALHGPASTVLGAFRAGDLVGTAMVGHDGHRGWVYYLAVTARHRGQGLGGYLMAACEGWLRERDVAKIQFMVRNGNDAALGFFDTLGYQRQDVVVLGRFLSG